MRDRHFPRLCRKCDAPMARQTDTCWRCGVRWSDKSETKSNSPAAPGAAPAKRNSPTAPGAAPAKRNSPTAPGAAPAKRNSPTAPGAAPAKRNSPTAPEAVDDAAGRRVPALAAGGAGAGGGLDD
jgi:hypothetical protein